MLLSFSSFSFTHGFLLLGLKKKKDSMYKKNTQCILVYVLSQMSGWTAICLYVSKNTVNSVSSRTAVPCG